MRAKRRLLITIVLLVVSFARLQQLVAQVPCTPTIFPSATLVVNWPQFQYDTAHTGCNPYESLLSPSTVGHLAVKWTQSKGLASYSSGVEVNNVIYTSVRLGDPFWNTYVEAYDATSGTSLWEYAGNLVTGFASPAVANGVVYAGSEDYNLYALSAKTGALLWQHTTGGEVSTPTIANGVVYVTSTDGNIYALNAATGALLWQYTTGVGMHVAPAIANGLVYVGAGQNVYALNATTGALVWKYASASSFQSSPAVANGKVYIAADVLYALNASTGALVWQSPAGSNGPPAIARGVLYVASGSNVYALNGATGNVIWQYQVSTSTISAPVVANGVVYVPCILDFLALDASTGAFLFLGSGSQFYSSPIVANGMVYFGTSQSSGNGSFYAYSLNGK